MQLQDRPRPLELSRVEDSSGKTIAPPPSKKKKGLSAILKHIEEENTQNVPADKIDNEVISYLDYHKMNPETNLLIWWKSEQRQFPTLSILARKY